jgi:hypothetical protein
MAAPYATAPPGELAAHAMLAQSVPMGVMQAGLSGPPGLPPGLMQAGGPAAAGMPGGVVQASGLCGPGGCAPGAGCGPAGMSLTPMVPTSAPPMGGVGLGGGAPSGPGPYCQTHRTSVRFASPAGMRVSWYAPGPEGHAAFGANQIAVPGRYNFLQAAIYRLKLSNIPNRPGLELYPTLEIAPATVKTDAYLAHSAVPVAFTDEDFDQVATGNFVVKVIYLPFPQFQDLATTGADEVVSTRLEPGVDPIAEAHRRGSILAIVRLGNIDLEAPNTPPMDAPNPYQNMHAMGPISGAHMAGPMVPYGMPGVPTGPALAPNMRPGVNGMPVPPGGPRLPAAPVSRPNPPPAGPGPVSQLPDSASPYQQVAGQAPAVIPTTAQLAGEGTATAPAEARTMWDRHGSSDDKQR